VVAGLLLCLPAGCGGKGEGGGATGAPAAAAAARAQGRGEPRQLAIPVHAEPVRVGEMVASVQTHARLEAERWVTVLARTTGLLQELLVEEGDRVRAGQVLARLQKDELRLQHQQAEVALSQVRASYERVAALHRDRMVSEAEFEAARLQLENAQLRLEEARLNLDYADITAPIDGVIMRRLVNVGHLVRANQELFELADLEPLLARVYVPEKRMHQIGVGQEVRLQIESLPDVEISGRIQMLSPGVDPQSGTVKVTVAVPDPGHRLRPGMFASVRIITDRHPRALIIPKKALVIETDDDDVYVVRDGVARRVFIQPGFVEGDAVEVLSGLAAGELVITVGAEGLKDGTPVRVVGAAGAALAADEARPAGGAERPADAAPERPAASAPARPPAARAGE